MRERSAKRTVGPRVLCVDDEPRVLEGLVPILRRFDLVMANSAAAGLEQIQAAPCAVVISDMRMPQMNGAEFLKRVREISPDTVRILLTGYADLKSAVSAVNEGQIFRFLTKPCSPEQLLGSVHAAVEQNRLITAEKELLEQTLHGCVQMLGDILSLTHPVAFGRANRIKKHVAMLLDSMGEKNRWHIEVAAMLVEIGAITLPEETLRKAHNGEPLTPEEQRSVDELPGVARRILGSIPRLDPVIDLLGELSLPAPRTLGGRVLRVALEFDNIESRGVPKAEAIAILRARHERYDAQILARFADLIGGELKEQIREIPLRLVEPGMTFVDDVRMHSGILLVARGYQVTDSFVARAKNFGDGQVPDLVRVSIPAPKV